MEDDELTLDEVRDFLYVALRAQERFTQNLRVLVEDLDKRKDDEEWLEQGQEEAAKGALFYDSQLQSWQGFSSRVESYVASVRRAADELAIEELQIEKKGAGDDGENPEGSRRRAKTIHPELKKFKLEKQARILGKYGGVPAMGAGLVMSLPPRDAILKATASPAAREIQYSKVEDKDARYLAEVMQFKSRKARASGSTGGGGVDLGLGGEPEQSPWQAEVIERKGKEFFKQHEAPPEANTAVHTPYAAELAAKLRQQQASLAASEAAAATPKRPDGSAPSVGSATAELADKLKRQQVTLKASEDEEARAAKAAAAEAAEAAHPTTPSTTWSNAASPFGQELSSVLQQRQQQQRAAAAVAPVVATPAGQRAVGQSGSGGGAAAAAANASPGFSFRAASNAIAGSGTPGTPAAIRRPAAAAATPAAGAASNELAELLKRRQARQAVAEEQ